MDHRTRPKCLLHCCCAPCFTHPYRLLSDSYRVTAFFYNPNIQPEKEYRAREEEIRRLAQKWGAALSVGEYDAGRWFGRVEGLEEEPENGARCAVCYRMRLEKTAEKAKALGFERFATTLSISPHKDADIINRIGDEIGAEYGLAFHRANFKKKDGFKTSCRISAEEGLYRQDYCGCIFSRRR